jgi:hypothetical protein
MTRFVRIVAAMGISALLLTPAPSARPTPVMSLGASTPAAAPTSGTGALGAVPSRFATALGPTAVSDFSGTITPGGPPVTATISTAGENAALTFPGTNGQRVFVGFSNNTISNNQCCNTVAWIKKPDGSALTSTARFIEGSNNFVDTATLPSSGTYTIFIDPIGSGTGSVTVTLYDVPPNPAPVVTPTPGGVSVTMTTTIPGQNFGPTVTATAGQRIFVGFSNNTIANNQCCNTVAWIKAPNGSALTSTARFIEGSNNYVDTTTLATAGTYTVVVDPQAFNTGSITVTIYDVPPDVAPRLELTPVGSSHLFTTATLGHNALPTFDGTATQPVSVTLTSNTIAGGGYCTVAARILNPDGSILSNNPCVSNSNATLGSVTLPTDGLYTIVVDPYGQGVGSVEITLYLDEPDVTPGGALYEDVVYVNGGSYAANVAAHFPNGVNRAWLEKTGTGEIATSSTCTAGPGACPQDVEAATTVDTTQLAEGQHEFVAKALGSNGNASDEEIWRIFVDRTAPAPPANFRVDTYDTTSGTATLAWDEGADPDLPGDVDGAGAASYDYRYRVDAQAWSAWLSTENPSVAVSTPPASNVELELKEIDGAGNTSSLVSATVPVSGTEGSAAAAEVTEPAFTGATGPLDPSVPDDTQTLSFTPVTPCPPGYVDDASAPTWQFTNCDGTWHIFRDCIDQNVSGGRYTVGPGYIAHMRTPGANGRVLVRDDRVRTNATEHVDSGSVPFGPLGAMNGGLGTFGFHYARSTNDPGQVPAGSDPTRQLSAAEAEVVVGAIRDARHVPVIEGRQCAGKNGNPNYGVYAVTHPPKLTQSGAANNPRIDSQGIVRFTVSVWFRDEWGNTGQGPNAAGDGNPAGDAIARVTYTYRFEPSVVRAWMAVTTFGSSSGGGTRYIKEPKFVAVIRGGGFSRLKVFGGAKGGLALPHTRNEPSEVRDGPVQKPNAVLSPRQIGQGDRTRIQWDYGTNACGNNCFSAVMRAYPVLSRTTGGVEVGRPAPLWEQTENLHAGFGLDWWARISGVRWQSRLQSYPRDTAGDFQWACRPMKIRHPTASQMAFASEDVTTNVTLRRRWEIGGWKETTTSVPFVLSGTVFSGWNGGRGPYDCEQMQVKFANGTESFGTFASYSVGPGWVLK